MGGLSWIGPTLALVASGALSTVVVALCSVVISIAVGVVLGVALCLPGGAANAALRTVLAVYLHVFRGLPVLVTLFIVFFVSPSAGLQLPSAAAAVVGLSLWGSANVMEVVRGAIRSIPAAQFEAAAALGFPWTSSMRLIVLPQATRRMLPPIVNLTVDLIQATTLASLIGVVEILQRSRQAVEFFQLNSGNGHAAAILGGVLVFFFVVCFPLTWLAGRMEKRGTTQARSATAPKSRRKTKPTAAASTHS